MVNVNKKWIIHILDETSEYGIKEIAHLVTTEVPIVGNNIKFCKIGTYEIIEAVHYTSTAIKEIEENEMQNDDIYYIVDTGDDMGRAVYGVVVKLAE